MKIFLIGYPGDMGGANTEAWHTVRLWRRFGMEVHLIPTWGKDPKWEKKLDDIGCHTHHVTPNELEEVPGLAGSVCVGMCNENFVAVAHRLRAMGCPLVWVNCMTFLFDHERTFCAKHGPFDAFVYQSQFQRSQLEPELAQYGYHDEQGHLIHGSFTLEEWPYSPRPHEAGEEFVVGRLSRPDADKWSSNTWLIYGAIPYAERRAAMLGWNGRTEAKCGAPPDWAECLPPQAEEAKTFFKRLHCLLPVNGGARENWPRVGLEAMATGVPIVTQDAWGWREMIEHGVTGFLGDNDQELAFYTAKLAYEPELRLAMAQHARLRVEQLTDPDSLWAGWQALLASLGVEAAEHAVA